jgi:hypothetical protein
VKNLAGLTANRNRTRHGCRNKFADLQLKLGKTDEALKLYQQSLDISLRLAQANPNDAELQRDVMVSFYKLGTFGAQQGDVDGIARMKSAKSP